VLLDLGSWAEVGLARGRRSATASALGTLAGQRDAAAALLRGSGWQVVVARADQSVPEVWTALVGPAGRTVEAGLDSLETPA
jgi:hypothetical protein